MFQFADIRPRRRPSLTPMIDVVFLLLVFFMLAARFGQDMAIPLGTAGTGAAYDGPPRLIEVGADVIWLNGVQRGLDEVIATLPDLMQSPRDTVVLRASGGADLQRLVDVLDALAVAGFEQVVLVESTQ